MLCSPAKHDVHYKIKNKPIELLNIITHKKI